MKKPNKLEEILIIFANDVVGLPEGRKFRLAKPITAINNLILEEVLELLGEDKLVTPWHNREELSTYYEAKARNELKAKLRTAATKRFGGRE